jgi:hypothetical protein
MGSSPARRSRVETTAARRFSSVPVPGRTLLLVSRISREAISKQGRAWPLGRLALCIWPCNICALLAPCSIAVHTSSSSPAADMTTVGRPVSGRLVIIEHLNGVGLLGLTDSAPDNTNGAGFGWAAHNLFCPGRSSPKHVTHTQGRKGKKTTTTPEKSRISCRVDELAGPDYIRVLLSYVPCRWAHDAACRVCHHQRVRSLYGLGTPEMVLVARRYITQAGQPWRSGPALWTAQSLRAATRRNQTRCGQTVSSDIAVVWLSLIAYPSALCLSPLAFLFPPGPSSFD